VGAVTFKCTNVSSGYQRVKWILMCQVGTSVSSLSCVLSPSQCLTYNPWVPTLASLLGWYRNLVFEDHRVVYLVQAEVVLFLPVLVEVYVGGLTYTIGKQTRWLANGV